MRKYRINAGSETRIAWGLDSATALTQFEETAGLAAAIRSITEAMIAALASRRALWIPLLVARAILRIADFVADRTIRAFAYAVQTAEGGRRGPLFDSIFPDGLQEVVAPAGARQLPQTVSLLERLKNSVARGAEEVRVEWLPKLESVVARLQGAVADNERASTAFHEAYANERKVREEHAFAVDRLAGQVRAAFPRDRALQDIVFPVPRRTKRTAGGEEGDTEETPEVTESSVPQP
ncbi:MAG: hypothetical protein HY720_16365 [Planctomycetes bacterium]|nr:hypothetical protein [Planctomycetota bacterium]